jgi:hypothetical protein
VSVRPLEWCREWIEEKVNYCHEPATVIIWGRLFPKEALGPRCDDHAAQRIGHDYYSDLSKWAVFDLRNLKRSDDLKGW